MVEEQTNIILLDRLGEGSLCYLLSKPAGISSDGELNTAAYPFSFFSFFPPLEVTFQA